MELVRALLTAKHASRSHVFHSAAREELQSTHARNESR